MSKNRDKEIEQLQNTIKEWEIKFVVKDEELKSILNIAKNTFRIDLNLLNLVEENNQLKRLKFQKEIDDKLFWELVNKNKQLTEALEKIDQLYPGDDSSDAKHREVCVEMQDVAWSILATMTE